MFFSPALELKTYSFFLSDCLRPITGSGNFLKVLKNKTESIDIGSLLP